MGMGRRVYRDQEALARAAADLVAEALATRPTAALVFPTGATPRPLFRELVARARRGEVRFDRCRIFCLDDYYPLPPDDPRSCFHELRTALLDPLGIQPGQVHRLPPPGETIAAACAAYEAAIVAAGGIDLAVLGLGLNGHLGFNEPGSTVDSRTRVVALQPDTVRRNAQRVGGTLLPDHGITMGIATLLEARKLLLLVTGEEKAGILARALREPVGPAVPASFLRLAADATVLADLAAARLLEGEG